MAIQQRTTTTFAAQYPHHAAPTSQYTYTELADIYNRAREDYIVPMPMNARRMEEYVTHYDISLDASMVALDNEDDEPNGICMLGVREDRTWITRLGVIPVRRKRKAGEFLMRTLIDESRRLDRYLVQLEVIRGNEPAYRLFRKLGFEDTRSLLVIRRPPGPLDIHKLPRMSVEAMSAEDIPTYLEQREPGAAWTEETASLQNAGNLRGLHVSLPDGETGWVIFHYTPFQLGHFVLSPGSSPHMMQALIAAVHQSFPLQDTKIENLPQEHPSWPLFQKMGYVEAFARIEMVLPLR